MKMGVFFFLQALSLLNNLNSLVPLKFMCKNSTFSLAVTLWKDQYFFDTLKRSAPLFIGVHTLSKSKTTAESSDQVLLHCSFITWIWNRLVRVYFWYMILALTGEKGYN